MFNLLPDNLKKQIKSEYKLRRFILIIAFVIFIQISFLIFLTPSWLVSVYKEKEAIIETENMNKSTVASSTNSVVTFIKSTNNRLSILNKVLVYPTVVPAVDLIISKKTKSIHIIELNYSSSKNTASISLSGVSDTREALALFQKSLESSGHFKSVNLPVSNLAKDKNIVFSMNLTISK